MRAAMHGHRDGMDEAGPGHYYFGHHIQPHQRNAVIDLFALACRPLRHADGYDFGTSDQIQRIRIGGHGAEHRKDFWHTPPADALFLHRKLGGMYLLAAGLKRPGTGAGAGTAVSGARLTRVISVSPQTKPPDNKSPPKRAFW